MKNDIFKTLFSRMLFTYLSVILCLLLLMGITVSSMFRNQYMQEEEQFLRRETEKINAILIEKYIYEEKRFVANEELLTIARRQDALIQIIDTQGNIRAFYSDVAPLSKWSPIVESSMRNEGAKAFVSLPGLDIYPEEGAIVHKRRFFDALGSRKGAVKPLNEQGLLFYNLFSVIADMPTLTLARTVINNEREDGVILMHTDLSSVNASIRQVYLDILLTGLVAVAAAVLVVYYLTTRITKPITDMNTTVKRYSKGDFDLRLKAYGEDEVAQLARSFNTMAGELSDLERLRRSFVANVSHELRSPLTSISGFLEAMQDGTIPKERHAEYLALVVTETHRMTEMVNDLLSLARMESGQVPLKLQQFDLNELALRTLVTFEARINQKKLQVELKLLKPRCSVEGDREQLAQVLRNLIDNAIKFSKEGGRLIIETALQSKGKAALSVHDFGFGIPQDDLPHVFERFYKAEKAHTPTSQSGTGLGLSIARFIIDLHGQNIWVVSDPEKGTKFTFTLPYVQEIWRRPGAKTEGV